uniref:Ig-like domain-containing protein n=1 Tax=Chelonoidis abingdonii TaxID=106734 RepID=A0A8C0GKX0_CHEAB
MGVKCFDNILCTLLFLLHLNFYLVPRKAGAEFPVREKNSLYFWEIFFFPPEQLSNPEFGSLQKSLEVGIGQNVTLSCRFTSGSLPINYIFFRGSQNLWPTIWKTDRNPALFNLTISSASDLGEYKCKVVHGISNSTKYSKSLNFTLLDPVSKPVLSTTTSQVRIGQNVTLSCHSENGSSPINYVFFKGRKTMLSKISMQGKAAAVLNVTINSSSDLSDYKCKAENNIPNNTKYSNSLNFTLAGMCLSYVLLIASDELLMISACLSPRAGVAARLAVSPGGRRGGQLPELEPQMFPYPLLFLVKDQVRGL